MPSIRVTEEDEMALLSVNSLRVSFLSKQGLLKAVRGVSFDIEENETLAIVGESGSGKSVTSKSILRLLGEDAIIEEGSVIYEGKDLLSLSENEMNRIRGREISIVFQDTSNTINPLMKIGQQFLTVFSSRNKNEKKEAKNLLKTLRKLDSTYQNETDAESLSLLLTKDKANALSKLKESEKELQTLQGLFASLSFTPSLIYKQIKRIRKTFCFETIVASSLLTKSQGFLASFLAKTRMLETHLKKKEKEERPEFKSEVYLNPKESYCALKESLFDFAKDFESELSKLEKEVPDGFSLSSKIISARKTLASKQSKEEQKKEALGLLEECGIEEPERVYSSYPFELSGGMRQRISIALALSYHPKLLICDEATTALDATVQEEILILLERLKKQYHCAILFITHDLSVVARLADKIVLMYGGKILERGTVFDIFYDPRSPYAWGLLSSSFLNDHNLSGIAGNPPSPYLPPVGDPFAERNAYALEEDFLSMPKEYRISPTHFVSSYLYEEGAEEVNPPEALVEHIGDSLKANPINIPNYENKKNSVLEILKKKGVLHE